MNVFATRFCNDVPGTTLNCPLHQMETDMRKIDLTANRREISVKPENRIKTVTKQADGSMALEFASGATGILPAGDTDIQAFAVYSILAEL